MFHYFLSFGPHNKQGLPVNLPKVWDFPGLLFSPNKTGCNDIDKNGLK